jgi:hypothetical protein
MAPRIPNLTVSLMCHCDPPVTLFPRKARSIRLTGGCVSVRSCKDARDKEYSLDSARSQTPADQYRDQVVPLLLCSYVKQ